MTIHRFYVDEVAEVDKITKYNDGDLINQMLKVLRLRDGEQVSLFNGNKEVLGEIIVLTRNFVEIKGIKDNFKNNELPCGINLYQSITNKMSKFEDIVRHSTELGVKKIVPIIAGRCQVDFLKKKDRLDKILKEASEQCERNQIPEIDAEIKIEQVLDAPPKGINVFLTARQVGDDGDKAAILLRKILHDKEGDDVNVFVGPEGGFTDDEIDKAELAGFMFFRLGKTVLRTETASLAFLAILNFIEQDNN
ncbi:16S rRNA (uracil(1498)-N(3))-methyltransferase [Patescibacteria group bacterium]|nr:16S rRNA (uracil(1498)-N(3))-methyltransferase [Patescibacteria group bacterium]